MSTCPGFTHLLVLPHLQIQNANAISSPLTHGFPSMTAFLGLMWALERKASAAGIDLPFNAVGVVCHDHQEQITNDGFVQSFRLTRNPVSKDGSTAAIVEEGRIHLSLTLVFAVRGECWQENPASEQTDIARIAELLAGMRAAGGTVIPSKMSGQRATPYAIQLTGTEEDNQKTFRHARLRLLPGSTLVARDDLIDSRWAELKEGSTSATRLDAWLSLARINWRYQPPTHGSTASKSEWVNDRKGRGWIVPIPVGYGALAELRAPGTVANSRDSSTPFRFVESLYSMGEWIGPHRLHSPQQLLWYADSQPDHGLYRCRNDYRPTSQNDDAAH